MKNIIGQTVIYSLLATGPVHGQQYTVEIKSVSDGRDYKCEPSQLTIMPGDSVSWVNAQGQAVVADSTANITAKRIPKNAESFASHFEKSGDSSSHTFNIAGTYVYNCSRDPSAQPAVIVVDKASLPMEMKDVR